MITATYKGKYYDVEYSIVNVSELEEDLRIGAETYHPEKIKTLSFLNKKANGTNIGQYFYLIKDFFDPKKSPPKKVKLLELEKMGNFEIFDIPEVSSTEFDSNKNIAKFGDVVISRLRPYLRQVGFIYLPEVYTTTELLILRQKNNEVLGINYYLYTFLMTRWVQKILFWSQEGVNHPRFPKYILLDCPMPLPSSLFIAMVKRLIENYFILKQKAEQFYKEAEEILLEELELKNWKPKTKKIKIGGREFEEEENISIRNLSEVIKADRIDAEYWEPKYDEIEELIKKYRGGYDYLPNLIDISKKKIKVNKDEIYSYIELADINPNLGVVNQTKHIKGKDLPSRARMKVEKGYVIMSSVEGSIDKIALIDFEKKNLVASTGFFVFKEKELNKETLLVLLKILAKKYIIREAQGTILTAIPYDSLSRIVLPRVESQIQQKISQLIQQSFKARENSKRLLEIAKRTVEIYIEKNEEEGLNYANNQLEEINMKVD
jgi:type I restriction enzyme S subunit